MEQFRDQNKNLQHYEVHFKRKVSSLHWKSSILNPLTIYNIPADNTAEFQSAAHFVAHFMPYLTLCTMT